MTDTPNLAAWKMKVIRLLTCIVFFVPKPNPYPTIIFSGMSCGGLGGGSMWLFTWNLFGRRHRCRSCYDWRWSITLTLNLFLNLTIYYLLRLDLVTVKYIYGPSTTTAAQDGDIGSSISGRLETGIGLHRLTTIPMPMRGTVYHFEKSLSYHYRLKYLCFCLNRSRTSTESEKSKIIS